MTAARPDRDFRILSHGMLGYGFPAESLARAVAAGIDLIAVSIGTPERATEFVNETGFPAANLYADPDNVCYDALKLNKELKNFSQKSTPEMLMERWNKDGAKDLIGVLKRWKPWIPPKPEQG